MHWLSTMHGNRDSYLGSVSSPLISNFQVVHLLLFFLPSSLRQARSVSEDANQLRLVYNVGTQQTISATQYAKAPRFACLPAFLSHLD